MNILTCTNCTHERIENTEMKKKLLYCHNCREIKDFEKKTIVHEFYGDRETWKVESKMLRKLEREWEMLQKEMGVDNLLFTT